MAPCAVCSEQEHKYTCPRCNSLTCSATCSKQHKAATGCTGERDKAAYIPMNEYSWGKLMDDYTFLEDMGRKVSDWGKEIVRNGYLSQQTQRAPGRGGARGNARRTAATRADGRRAFLRTQLDLRDIDMELLPDGMARRKLNQSFWDSRLKTAMLTMELVLHAPTDTLALATNPPLPITLVTHRNDFSRSVADVVRSAVTEQSKRKGKNVGCLPEWTTSLVDDGAETLYLVAQTDIGPQGKTTEFRKLDATLPLSKALKRLTFVEFPTIHVWDTDAFTGPLADEPPRWQDGLRPTKRRKVDSDKGKCNMLALVGDYASDEEIVSEDGDDVGSYDSEEEGVGDDESPAIAGLDDIRNEENYDEDDDDGGVDVHAGSLEAALSPSPYGKPELGQLLDPDEDGNEGMDEMLSSQGFE